MDPLSSPRIAGPASTSLDADRLAKLRVYSEKTIRLLSQNQTHLVNLSDENRKSEFGQPLVNHELPTNANAIEAAVALSSAGLDDGEDDFGPIFASSNELESAVALAGVVNEDSFDPSIECRVGEIPHLTAVAYKKIRCADCGLETGDNVAISSHVWQHLATLLNDQSFLLCVPCSQGFVSVELVKRHMQKIHGIVGDDAQIPLIEDCRPRFVRQYMACFRRCYPGLQEVTLGPCSILVYFEPEWMQQPFPKKASPLKSAMPRLQKKRLVTPGQVISQTSSNLSRLETLKQDVINAASGCYPVGKTAIYDGVIEAFPANLSEMPANACMCAVCDEVPKLGRGQMALGEHAWRHVQEAIVRRKMTIIFLF